MDGNRVTSSPLGFWFAEVLSFYAQEKQLCFILSFGHWINVSPSQIPNTASQTKCQSGVRRALCLGWKLVRVTCPLFFATSASIRSQAGKKVGCDRIRHIKWLTPGSGAKIVTCHFSCVNFYTSRLEFTHGFIFFSYHKPSKDTR